MGGSTNSLAPCSLVGEEPSLWTSLSPPGLSSTVDQFSTIIQPHMNERFDKLVCVGINEDRVSAASSEGHNQKGQGGPQRQSPGCSGTLPCMLLCSNAMMSAVKRKIACVTDGLDTEDTPLMLSADDFNQALDCLKLSVSEQELLKYKLIQQKLTAK